MPADAPFPPQAAHRPESPLAIDPDAKGSRPVRLARRLRPGFGRALASAAWTWFATVLAAAVRSRNPSTDAEHRPTARA